MARLSSLGSSWLNSCSSVLISSCSFFLICSVMLWPIINLVKGLDYNGCPKGWRKNLCLKLGRFRESQPSLLQRLAEQDFDLGLLAIPRHSHLADQQISAALQHLLFAEGERFRLAQQQQSLQNSGNFQQRPGTHPLRVFLETVLPVGVIAALAILQKIHDLLDFPVLYYPAQADR